MDNRDIIVIGGSSGATAPLKSILGALPRDLPAAVFIVLHIPARSIGILTTVTQASTQLPVRPAVDGMPIEPGHIYLGVPDRHLILVDGHIKLGRGPRENMARPAIDPLFRSAAAAYGSRVVGVLLSGFLNDGAAGLSAIKRCGGLALVQDPTDAIADEMPLAALRAVTADLVSPSHRIGDVLSDLVREPAGPRLPIPPEIQLEVDIAAGERVDSSVLRQIADPVALPCPQCGGVLSQVREPGPLRFRCQVGHAMTGEVLASEQENAVDEALRVALRVIEERAELVARMAEDGRNSGRRAVAEMYEERSQEYRRYADTIRRAVLMTMSRAEPTAEPSGHEGGQDGGS
jgi:two-component system chemotaxis response regulator CheB